MLLFYSLSVVGVDEEDYDEEAAPGEEDEDDDEDEGGKESDDLSGEVRPQHVNAILVFLCVLYISP